MIDVDAINAAVPSPLIAAQLLGLKVARGSRDHRAVVLCPWHNEKHPSCVLVEKNGKVVAHCKACSTGGDFISMVAAVNGIDHRHDFRRAAEIAAGLVGVHLPSSGGDETRDARSRVSGSRPGREPGARRDPVVDLAARIDGAARDWLRGRDCKPDPVIDNASKAHVDEALELLAALVDRSARRSRDLERLAIAYEASSRNLWAHPPQARSAAA